MKGDDLPFIAVIRHAARALLRAGPGRRIDIYRSITLNDVDQKTIACTVRVKITLMATSRSED